MHFRLTILISVGVLLAAAGRSNATELGRIMPLGDSITAGYIPGGSIPGGYRQELYNNLQTAGHSFTLVGSQTIYSSSTLNAAGQNHHEGHDSYTIQQTIDGVANHDWLGVNPDIILLHIGANDILASDAATAPDRLDTLLGEIIARKPEARILVAKIIGGSTVTNDSRATTYDSGIVAYNAAIEQKVIARANPRLSLIDMYSLMNINHQTNELGQPLFTDISHPTQIGYNQMGDAWAGAIKTFDVPEPGAIVLLGAGLLSLLAYAWRKFLNRPVLPPVA